MDRRADGTFVIEFTPIPNDSGSRPQTEDGIWTHSNGAYKTITLRVNGKPVNTGDEHYSDVYEVVSLDGGVLKYHHKRMNVTFQSEKVSCGRSVA